MDIRIFILLTVVGIVFIIIALFAFQGVSEEAPKLDNEFAIRLIKNYYLERGVNLEELSSNYVNASNETEIFSYVYRQKYDGWKFIIKIYYKPANIYLSECSIRENKVLECLNTEEGDDFIQKYT